MKYVLISLMAMTTLALAQDKPAPPASAEQRLAVQIANMSLQISQIGAAYDQLKQQYDAEHKELDDLKAKCKTK